MFRDPFTSLTTPCSPFIRRMGYLTEAIEMRGRSRRQQDHDAAFLFRFFPHYPVLLLFSDAVPEENFPAQCTMLLDRNAPRYLDIESMVVLGEEFAGRLTG